MRYIPHAPADIRAMLDGLGLDSVDDLFRHIPTALRERARLRFPSGLPESAVIETLRGLADKNRGAHDVLSFMGAGAYAHFIPSAVDAVLLRAEFATAYTPYQPEVSQGTLQAAFEFQSLVAALLGMDVANASMYDGASATAEAVLMAKRIVPKRNMVVVSRGLHPQYRQVLHTYVTGLPHIRLCEVPFGADGRIDQQALANTLSEATLCVVVGYPNFFGILEEVGAVTALARQHGALTISVTTEAIALGLLKSPGEWGCDIAVGEGQSLGLPMSFGGPGVGLFATRERFLRNMPGRLVGETVDGDGQRGFVLTLATREQHIRREKATSNICTNHGLCALAATVFLCLMGKDGLRRLAEVNVHNAHATLDILRRKGCGHERFSSPFFNEFVLEIPHARRVWQELAQQNMVAGIPLDLWYPELRDCLLLCATEMHTGAQIERLATAMTGCIDGTREGAARAPDY